MTAGLRFSGNYHSKGHHEISTCSALDGIKPGRRSRAAGCAAEASRKKTPAVSASELEARKHYRIALVAIQNNDLPTAEGELAKAVELSTKNVLMLYTLAMVESKRNNLNAADSNLAKAEKLGIPAAQKEAAENLRADIDYKLKVQAKQEEAARAKRQQIEQLRWIIGSWAGENKQTRDRGLGEDPKYCLESISTSHQDLYVSMDGENFKGVAHTNMYKRSTQGGAGCRAGVLDQLSYGQMQDEWRVDGVWPGGDTDSAIVRISLIKCDKDGDDAGVAQCPWPNGGVIDLKCVHGANKVSCSAPFFLTR